MRGGAGRTRTNHQSVMECGGVRPTHLVGHLCFGRSRPSKIAGHLVVLADFPGVLMRGAVVLVRPAPLVGHLCLGPLAPIQIAVNVAIVSDRNFLFPGNREPPVRRHGSNAVKFARLEPEAQNVIALRLIRLTAGTPPSAKEVYSPSIFRANSSTVLKSASIWAWKTTGLAFS